ncbi:MAG: ATP-binding protein [Holosporales bacterium]|jgi:anti-sigma regulatory factor (Ser/Thr protein kinase)|nr:ATP-binding protein [Holosporales bacterium]
MNLTLGNDIAEVTRLCEAIESFCAERNLSTRLCHDLLLILDELVTNVIVHGFSTGVGGRIQVRFELREDNILVEVADDAPAFDPLQKSTPDVSASLEERSIGGLGIHLIRQFSQYMTYCRKDDRNIIELSLKR